MIELQDFEKVSVRKKLRASLREIKKDSGKDVLMAEDVVDAAAHPDHALHSYFCWDDTEAARQYRLSQARGLIRKVMVSGPDPDSPAVPEWVSLRQDRAEPGGGYRETSEVINSKDLLAQLEDTAKKDIDGVLNRYNMLRELCERVRKAAGIATKKKAGKQRSAG